MSQANTYSMHVWPSTVTPANDFSGMGVWNANGAHMGTSGPHANEHYAFDGLVIQPPQGLNTLQSGMVDIQGSPYKAATMYVQPVEFDEAQNFVNALSAFVGKAVQLHMTGWGNDENGVITCYHSVLYWSICKDPGNFEFAVFAAASQRILPGPVSATPEYIDCGSTNIQTISSPTGRLSSMTNSAFLPPGIAQNTPSPELLNPSFPQIG